jgi:hypothetical protein
MPVQHAGGNVKSSSCPSNREGLKDSLGGSGLSFLVFVGRNYTGIVRSRLLFLQRPVIVPSFRAHVGF